MHPDHIVAEYVAGILGLLAVGFLGTTVGFAVAWMRARERAVRAEHTRAEPADAAARFERIEQAIDAVAVEVERVGEAQRFQSALLAERVGVAPARPAAPARVVTPH
jgi:hypothetical protein